MRGERWSEGWGVEKAGLRGSLLLLSSDSATCLGLVAVAAAAAVAAPVPGLAFALAHSAASDSDTKNCACLGFEDCSGFHSCLVVADRDSFRRLEWMLALLLLLLHSIAAEAARSNFRNCLAVADRGSGHRSVSMTIPLLLLLLLLRSIAVAVVDSDSVPSS